MKYLPRRKPSLISKTGVATLIEALAQEQVFPNVFQNCILCVKSRKLLSWMPWSPIFWRISKLTRFYSQNIVLKSIWKKLLLCNMQNSQLQYWARGPARFSLVAAPVLEIRLCGTLESATFLMVIEKYHVRDFPAVVRAVFRFYSSSEILKQHYNKAAKKAMPAMSKEKKRGLFAFFKSNALLPFQRRSENDFRH